MCSILVLETLLSYSFFKVAVNEAVVLYLQIEEHRSLLLRSV